MPEPDGAAAVEAELKEDAGDRGGGNEAEERPQRQGS